MQETTDAGFEAAEAVGVECHERQKENKTNSARKKRTQKHVDGTERKGKQYEEKPHLHAMERAMAEWTKQKKTKKRTVAKEASRQGQQLEPRPGKKKKVLVVLQWKKNRRQRGRRWRYRKRRSASRAQIKPVGR